MAKDNNFYSASVVKAAFQAGYDHAKTRFNVDGLSIAANDKQLKLFPKFEVWWEQCKIQMEKDA